MRKANTTFVNLRSALDDLDPLVDDAKPVVRDEAASRSSTSCARSRATRGPPCASSRGRSAGPAPTTTSSSCCAASPRWTRSPTRPPSATARTGPARFPTTIKAFEGVTKQVAFLRPYAPDLVGWFDDFSTTGAYDALGNFSRAGLQLNGFTLGPLLNALPIPPSCATCILAAGTHPGRNNRCPGSIERRAPDGSNPYKPSPDFNCDDTQVPIGP